MERSELLTRVRPPLLWAVMEEHVLRRELSDPAIMAEQIDHLLKMTSLPNVTLQIMPFSAGPHPGMFGPFQLFRFEIPELPDIIYTESLTGAVYHDERPDTIAYLEVLDRMGAQAASVQDTVAILGEIRKEL